MATKDDLKRQPPKKKLTLSKETIRDLAPRPEKADVLRGGGKCTSNAYASSCP